jgi:PhnB protein
MNAQGAGKPIRTSLAPWLSVRESAQAVEFYKKAFGAVETYHLDGPEGGVVSRLSVEGAEFWLSDEAPEAGNYSPHTLGGATTRLILTVPDPQPVFDRAVAAGAQVVFPVTEEHGWRLGRIVDPYGHHWEIGHPIVG